MTKPVIIGIEGPVLTRAERDLLRAHRPKGVILFRRNIESERQLAELTAFLRNQLPEDGAVMVDQEGGRVARLRAPLWPELPAAATLGTREAAFAHGKALAAMVRDAGFDTIAAPVLDLGLPSASSIIGDRALSDDPEIVAMLGAAIAEGILAEGVTPIMKHLPGHGRAQVDSHFALPRVAASEAELAADFYPFIANNNLPWAMTAHIVYPALDADYPATLSQKIISRIIRGVIGFKGILVSDDLAMEALTGSPAARAVAALQAGCDLALYCPGDMAGNLAILQACPMLHEALSGILATLVAIILHELAHGLAALAMGDTTAQKAGRLSLNPLKHIDKVGSVFLPVFLAVSQLLTIGRVAFMFGWAKPVPIDALALNIQGRHNPRRLMAIVAIAGPMMNFLLAFIGALALYAPYGTVFWGYFIVVNLVLGLFNLIPLPPMDGGRIAVGLLPLPAARLLAGSEKFGILLVFMVVFILPTALGQLGYRFNPVNDVLSAVLPWASDTVMHLAGHKNGL